MTVRTTARWTALALATALALTGCMAGDRTNRVDIVVGTTVEGLEKRGADEIRTDTNPLTSRFSALGTPVSVEWMSGTVGDAPGPSTYWIDAVVRLEESVAADLREQAPATTDVVPTVVEPLRDRLPDGPLLRSPALDEAFGESGFWSEAYLAQDEPVLVLVSLGE